MSAFHQRAGFPWLLVLLMAAMNIGLLAFLWLRPAPSMHPPHHGPPPGKIPDILGFDDRQRAELKAMQVVHFAQNDSMRAEMGKAREALFDQLKGGKPDSANVAAALDRLAAASRAIEATVFSHFMQIRGLCRPEQQATFDEKLPELIRRPPPPGGPGPRGHHGPPP